MKCIQPSYVKNFKCDGKICGARCCRDWRIVVDEETYEKYERLEDSEREKVFENLDWVEDERELVDVMVLKLREDGVCSFLGEDSLCSLQKKFGEEYLTAICQSFPRVTYRLDDEIFEQALTLTCPLAAHLILFPEKSLTFEETAEVSARAIISFKKKLSRPPEEFIQAQLDAIKILQERGDSINRRLKNLCRFFAGKKLPAVEFSAEKQAAALVEIFVETYGVDLSDANKANLRDNFLAYRKNILQQAYENFGHMFENYLANEFFLRCYPSAFDGDEFHNCKIFVTGFKVLEFALVLTVIGRRKLGLEDVTTLIYSVNDMLDHSRGGMDAIVGFVESVSNKNFAALMLED